MRHDRAEHRDRRAGQHTQNGGSDLLAGMTKKVGVLRDLSWRQGRSWPMAYWEPYDYGHLHLLRRYGAGGHESEGRK